MVSPKKTKKTTKSGKTKKPNIYEREHNREIRQLRVSELYMRGYSYRQIRKTLIEELDLDSYSLDTVKKDIDAIHEEWHQQRVDNVDSQKMRELATLDALLLEAWEAWDKSKTDYKQKSAKVKGVMQEKQHDDGVSEREKKVNKFEQSDKDMKTFGNPRYLEVIIKILERKAKILGYETIPVEISGTVHNISENYDFSALPTDVLVEIAYKMQDAEFNRQSQSN